MGDPVEAMKNSQFYEGIRSSPTYVSVIMKREVRQRKLSAELGLSLLPDRRSALLRFGEDRSAGECISETAGQMSCGAQSFLGLEVTD
jgi:hypothetical protein